MTHTTRRTVLCGLSAALASPLTGRAALASGATVPSIDSSQWERLDSDIRTWWDKDLRRADEDAILSDPAKGLLFLPYPYVGISPNGGTYYQMFPFDTAFMNYALLAHNRTDIVRGHILNYLLMIERYGFMPNANSRNLLSRSQIQLIPWTIWRYYQATKDREVLSLAYPLLCREFSGHWNGPTHQTPIGLSTCRDLGDPTLSPELASEAETGMDWMPIYNGDVRRCAPLVINCMLVRYSQTLALIAAELGYKDDASKFDDETKRRTALINKYCWSESRGLFLEYDFVAEKQLPYVSECAYWTLWAGVADQRQAERLVANLPLIEKKYGITVTDKAYPDPHPDDVYKLRKASATESLAPGNDNIKDYIAPDAPAATLGGRAPLMWMYPAGWATTQIFCVAGLDRYGFSDAAERVSAKYLGMVLNQYRITGKLWEKYNLVDGSLVLPNSRYGNIPYHSFTAAAVVLLGRRVCRGERMTDV